MSELMELDGHIDPLDKLLNDLNFQQEQFALAYLANGGNASGAAREAGYQNPDQTGWRLVRHPKVRAYIDAARAARREIIDMQLREKHLSPDALIAMVADMARFDLSEVLDERGIIDRSKLKRVAKELQSVEIDGAKTKIKGPDRLAAIRLIADYLGILKKDQTNVQVNVDFGDLMQARMKRALGDR